MQFDMQMQFERIRTFCIYLVTFQNESFHALTQCLVRESINVCEPREGKSRQNCYKVDKTVALITPIHNLLFTAVFL